jgi:hypothetical protein
MIGPRISEIRRIRIPPRIRVIREIPSNDPRDPWNGSASLGLLALPRAATTHVEVPENRDDERAEHDEH